MRNHEFYSAGCDFTEDGLKCGARPEDPVHLAGVVHSEATEFEEPFPSPPRDGAGFIRPEDKS